MSGGSLFLFDRKVLRYFRKDGHNWRKKKDGKTVKEAHEKLKVSNAAIEDGVFSFLLYNFTNSGSLYLVSHTPGLGILPKSNFFKEILGWKHWCAALLLCPWRREWKLSKAQLLDAWTVWIYLYIDFYFCFCRHSSCYILLYLLSLVNYVYLLLWNCANARILRKVLLWIPAIKA